MLHNSTFYLRNYSLTNNYSAENRKVEAAEKRNAQNVTIVIWIPRRAEDVDRLWEYVVVQESRVDRKQSHQQDNVSATKEHVPDLYKTRPTTVYICQSVSLNSPWPRTCFHWTQVCCPSPCLHMFQFLQYIAVAGPTTWNTLPQDTCKCTSFYVLLLSPTQNFFYN